MFWAFLIAAAIAIVFIQLGAMSVWVTILKAMLVVVLAVALFVCLLFVWQAGTQFVYHHKCGQTAEAHS